MTSYSQPSMKSQLNIQEICNKLLENMKEDSVLQQFYSQLMSKKSCSYDTRVKHVYEYLARYQLMPKKPYASKCDYFAQQATDEGNRRITNQEYKRSLDFYKDAIRYATASKTISIAYANRSAALYHLKKYRESLIDINRAIEAGCVEKLMPELLLREKLCERAIELTHAVKAVAEDENEKLRQELFRPPEKRMNGVSCASASLEISYSESLGRSVMATEDIQPGQVLVVEDPYQSVLNVEHRNFRCNFCCTFNYNMIPCGTCIYTFYCNEECRTNSWNQGHKFECPILTRSDSMGLEKIGMLPMRILLKARCQHPSWDKFFETVDSVKKEANTKSKDVTLNTNDGNHYAPIYMHETNMEKWNKHEMFTGCLVSAVLLYMLKEYTAFFADFPNVSDNDLTMENGYFWRVGGLLLRHFFSSKINPFGIYEFFKDRTDSDMTAEFARGVYAFSNLFNHSCSPNSNFVFRGATITVLASRLIKKGQQVCISYGENYWKSSLFRRSKLETLYKFKCECEACINNWPQRFNLQPARFVSKENKKQFRHIVNESSLRSFLQKDNKIDLNFVKELYKYVAMLEECVPSKELYYYQEFILINWMLLGNMGSSDINSYTLDDNDEEDDNDDDDDYDYIDVDHVDFYSDVIKNALFEKLESLNNA